MTTQTAELTRTNQAFPTFNRWLQVLRVRWRIVPVLGLVFSLLMADAYLRGYWGDALIPAVLLVAVLHLNARGVPHARAVTWQSRWLRRLPLLQVGVVSSIVSLSFIHSAMWFDADDDRGLYFVGWDFARAVDFTFQAPSMGMPLINTHPGFMPWHFLVEALTAPITSPEQLGSLCLFVTTLALGVLGLCLAAISVVAFVRQLINRAS